MRAPTLQIVPYVLLVARRRPLVPLLPTTLEISLSAIALDLLTTLLHRGDITPIQNGDFRREHCLDPASETLFDFIASYKYITDGRGTVPPLTVIKDRFPTIQLPEIMAGADVPTLLYEVRLQKARMQLQELTVELGNALEAADIMAEVRQARDRFDQILRSMTSTRDMSFEDVAIDILDSYSSGELTKHGYPWPWKTMNDATSGLVRGEFYVLSGRPKSRKTFIALYMAAFLFMHCNLRVLFVSPEMPASQVMLRFIAFLAAVDYAEFKKSSLTPEEEAKLFDQISRLYDTLKGVMDPEANGVGYTGTGQNPAGLPPCFIVTQATSQPVTYVTAKIKEHRPDVVVVDSFYRLGVVGGKYDADWKVVTMVSRQLKDIAMEQNVVLIATHQLNRDSEQKIGSLANLAGADAVGQDCDMAIRVITARRKDGDRSALYILGGRETRSDGVIIYNEPCSNFTEIEPITNKNKVLNMLVAEDEADMEEENANAAKKAPKKFGGSALTPMRTLTPQKKAAVTGLSATADSFGEEASGT